MARIALYAGGGAPYHHAGVLARDGNHIAFVFPDEIRDGVLEAFDVFVLPGGSNRAMLGQLEPLGSDGARAIVSFVEGGGMYVSSCAGSYCAANVGPAFRAACPVKDDLDLLDAAVFNDDPAYPFGLRSPGVGVLRVRNVAPGHPVMRGLPDVFSIVHYNGPLFVGAQALAVVDGAEADFTAGERFLDPDAPDDLLDRAVAAGAASVVVGERGAGRVVLFGSHPEFGINPAMDDQHPASQMLLNAVGWQIETTGGCRDVLPVLRMDDVGGDRGELAADVAHAAEAVRSAAAAIADLGPSPWLERSRAMSVFGREPADVLSGALLDIDRLIREIIERAPVVPAGILGFRAHEQFDGGYNGVLALLETASVQLDRARALWTAPVPDQAPANAYAELETSPYHQVAGSYLAAVGTIASAALLCRATVPAPSPVLP
jgi:glutamine amidotransferase-like uncharacterized protein